MMELISFGILFICGDIEDRHDLESKSEAVSIRNS